MTRVHLAELAGAAALAGNEPAAERYLARSDALRTGANRLFEPWIELNRAWVAAGGGTLSRAAELALAAADLARETEQPTTEARCLYDAARLGAATVVRRRLTDLSERLGGWYAAALAAAANGLAAGDPRPLDRASTELAEHGHLLLAAEAAAAAARLHRRRGYHAAAAASHARAAALAEACPGARTPLLRLDGPVSVLTQREREVAQLAVAMPSRQIASRLRLSVRTVNNHLGHAYTKLGVTNRRELAAALNMPAEPAGPDPSRPSVSDQGPGIVAPGPVQH
jgi:DNA-binding CsgD family transcriptional regulator